ncbi:MAG TPA: bifunctional hydroxymethylpyrimidine kinase/phosphomethylpyrimidine kinase [Blastocatellia bacterium]|nr:bifunctional hydroxymethylpyrimidine kinase/phosphomethylpyrimidine kinase [Blastocatellia bacterium]
MAIPQVLTIAGSDSGGGAGIQADLKALQANGAYGLSVITSITAQNTMQVITTHDLPIKIIEAQLNAVFSDFDIVAIKTGMLSSKEIVLCVASKLMAMGCRALVVDPVMVSTSGFSLLNDDAVESLQRQLFPLAAVVTPNIQEAESLTGIRIRDVDSVKQAAKEIIKTGCAAVLVKGGHLIGDPIDILFDGTDFTLFEGERILTKNTHGTGCTYSSAIAANLAKGMDLKEAVAAAKRYVTEAIRNSLDIGHGQGPVDHFYFLRDLEEM